MKARTFEKLDAIKTREGNGIRRFPRKINIENTNLEDQKGERKRFQFFSSSTDGKLACRLPPLGCTHLPSTKLRSLNKQITCLVEGFPAGLSPPLAHATHVVASLSPFLLSFSLLLSLFLLSKNCNALARDPLSIPLLNLRPYYRMPRERGASRRPKGADIEIQHASKPSKRRRPRRFHAVAERGGGSAQIKRNNSLR